MNDRKIPLRFLFLVCASLVFASGCGKTSDKSATGSKRVLTIYVPCGMVLPFTAAKEAFESSHPEVTVNVVLDNGNVIVRRILDKGEQPDMVVSPGTLEMKTLEDGGAVSPGAVQPFGQFELVLFAPRSNPAGVSTMSDLLKPSVKNLAIADPKDNSVGLYTMQALKAAGLWEKLQDKITRWDHPITAYKHVAREAAQASFAYRSCPLKTAPEKLEYSRVRILESVPKDSYDPAFACIAVLAKAAQPELAKEFLDLLLSVEGQKLLRENDIPSLPRLTLLIPCGMSSPFFRLQETFEEKHPGILLNLIVDRANALSERILKKGETADLHFSIGEVETGQLLKAGAIKAENARGFGKFQLALVTHRTKTGLVTTLQDIAKPEVKRILLTSTEDSSVGHYAQRALRNAGLWNSVKDKISYLPTLKDCYAELAAGKADAGFAYIGCPVPADKTKAKYSKVQVATVLPEQSYGSATAYASRLSDSPHPLEAELFVQFLLQPDSTATLATVGVSPLATPGLRLNAAKTQ